MDKNKAVSIGEIVLLFFCLFIPGIPGGMSGYILVALPQILLLAYILWLKKDLPLRDFGLRPPESRDILHAFFHAFLLFLIYIFFVSILLWLPPGVREFLLPEEKISIDDGSNVWILLLFCLVIGYREELFFRAYLLNRLQQLGTGRTGAIIISSTLFALFHLYEGLLGLLFTFGIAVYFSLLFLRTRSLHMIAISHGLYNVIMFFIYRLNA